MPAFEILSDQISLSPPPAFKRPPPAPAMARGEASHQAFMFSRHIIYVYTGIERVRGEAEEERRRRKREEKRRGSSKKA